MASGKFAAIIANLNIAVEQLHGVFVILVVFRSNSCFDVDEGANESDAGGGSRIETRIAAHAGCPVVELRIALVFISAKNVWIAVDIVRFRTHATAEFQAAVGPGNVEEAGAERIADADVLIGGLDGRKVRGARRACGNDKSGRG